MSNPAPATDDGALRAAIRAAAAGPRRSRDLTAEEARQAALVILEGRGAPAQIGGLLLALRVKPETSEELAGFTLAVRDHSTTPEPPPDPYVDCAGAYDGRVKSVPVGPGAALVAAEAGVSSLFHGAQSLGRSGLGPGPLLAGLEAAAGAPLPDRLRYAAQEDYCPPLAALRRLRNELGLRTAFNTAEKLAGPWRRVRTGPLLVGVFHGGYLELVARAILLLGIPRALVIQGMEGSDDLSVTRDSRALEIRDGGIRTLSIGLESVGIERQSPEALECHGLDQALGMLRPALAGHPGPVAEALALNTAARLYLADRAEDLADGVVEARRLIASGAGSEWGFRGHSSLVGEEK